MKARTRRLSLRLGACVVISLLLAGLTAWLSSADRLGRFEGIASDQAFPLGETDSSVVVVAIDATALDSVETPWPWPRAIHATLVRALDAAGAGVIVFDVAFTDARSDDADLAAAIRDAGNVVLTATSFSVEDQSNTPSPNGSQPGIQEFSLVWPTPDLADAAMAVGHANVTRDRTDGVVRHVPLVVEDDDRRIVPSLSLATLGVAADQPPDPIVRRPSGVQVANRAIPTNQDYEIRVSYPKALAATSLTDTVISAADVFTGRADDDVAGKTVFIGVTDVSLGDRMLTPMAKGSGLPGVLVHASAYNTMVTRDYLSLASTLEVTMWVLFVSLILTLAVQFLPAWFAGAVAAGLFAVYLLTAYIRVDLGTIMNFTYPTMAVALAVPLSGVVRYLVEIRQTRRVRALFSQYVPPSVAAQLIDEGRVGSAAEGARVEATALFVDLRGFTKLSSELEPAQVNRMLSDFYEYTSGIVLEHGGTVMTYIGDEVFAIFGAPVPSEDHASPAVGCARDLQERVGDLDAALALHEFDPLRFGIGLNAGGVIVAHAGSTWRRQYTAIGDPVNVASRLCSQAGPGQVVLSESVRAATDPPPEVTPLGPVEMKGVRADLRAWTLVLAHPPSGTRSR